MTLAHLSAETPVRFLPTAVALLALLAPPLAAQSAVEIPYERFVLPNGLFGTRWRSAR